VRVIAGSARGRKLGAFRGLDIRPTPDRVREGVFNVLGDSIPGSVGLDLFAGSGGVGIEALSRGAAEVVFVDAKKRSTDLIRRNLSLCGFDAEEKIRFRVIGKSYDSTLDLLRSEGRRFDWIYVDPPYKPNLYDTVLHRIAESEIRNPAGVVLVEHFHKTPLLERIGPLSRFRTLAYGSTRVSLYR
jgi:16S rRNA (guanine(966)-N(2))-methyltransferase RsmD